MAKPTLQYALFPPKSDWRPPRVSDLPSWKGAKRVGFDVETCDPHIQELGVGVRRGSFVAGYSFSLEDGSDYYVPLRHFGGDNVEDPGQALRYLKDQAKYFDGEVVGANLPYDLDHVAELDVLFPKVSFFRDVQIADPLIYELHDSYKLDSIAERWGVEGKDEDLLRQAAKAHGVDPKAELWKLPARFVGAYAQQDTRLPLTLLRMQEQQIDADGLREVYDLECRVLPVLLKMRRRGVRVDEKKLEAIERWSAAEEEKALREIHHHTGRKLALGEVNRAASLAPILKELGQGMALPMTPKSKKEKVDQSVLAGIDHPVARAIERARKVNKLRTSFAASVRKHMVKGRIHATFNQLRRERDSEEGSTGAAYGRLSCVQPNMQQQPARDEFATEWRSIYIPEEGCRWVSRDFSAQEPRMMTHFALASGPGVVTPLGYKVAEEMAERYRTNPYTDPHLMGAEIIGWGAKGRKPAKTITLGVAYGMGGAKLCDSIGYQTTYGIWDKGLGRIVRFGEKWFDALAAANPRKVFRCAGAEGQAILDAFDEAIPYVRKLAKEVAKAGEARGWVRTVMGRRCHFPSDGHGGYQWTHKGFNRIVQGSCGDLGKKALVDMDDAGYFLQLQVHDEFCSSEDDFDKVAEGGKIMENCLPRLRVPMRVDTETGSSWGDSMR